MAGALFAVRHEVRVVVDQDRHRGGAGVLGERSRQAASYVVAVPAGHDRRLDDPAGVGVDRAGDRESDAADLVRPVARLLQELGEPAAEFAEYGVGSVLDDQHAGVLGEDLAGQREDGGPRVPGVQVGGEDDGVGVVELERDGGAAAQG